MIFQNGYITFITKEGGGLDSDGFPVEPKESSSLPIPCQWRHINQNLIAKVQSEHFTLADYEVIIELRESVKDPVEVLLTIDDEERTEVVRRKVKSIDHLRMVRRTKIYF